MSHSYFNELLQKYISKEISSDEFSELKEHIRRTSDDDLMPLLQRQWENQNEKTIAHDADVKDILGYIRANTRPAPSIAPVAKHRVRWYQMAGVAAIAALCVLSVYLYLGKQEYARLGERDIVVSAGKGERASITLPDGTKVRLNSETELSYKQDFGRTDRLVSLTGEGYFEVFKDSGRPFRVHTEFLNVEVLGTTFNMYAYEKNTMVELALITGSVRVTTNSEPVQTAQLQPNEKAIFDTRTNQLSVEKTTNYTETAWVKNELVFRSETLENALKQVSRKYGVTIDLQWQDIRNDKYTGVFDKEDINEVLHILQSHYGFEYKIDKDTVYITQSLNK